MAGASSWEVVFKHLILAESHWTAQLQDQQQRIGSILAVNGFVLGASGFTGAIAFRDKWPSLGAKSLAVGLSLLALAVVFGLLAMKPRTPIGGTKSRRDAPDWLVAPKIVEVLQSEPEDPYRALAASLAKSMVDSRYHETLKARRTWMYFQLVCIGIGLFALAVSVGALVSSGA